MIEITANSTAPQIGQRVRIKQDSGIRYGYLGHEDRMKSADGLEGVLIGYREIPPMYGGSRWTFKADDWQTFELEEKHFIQHVRLLKTLHPIERYGLEIKAGTLGAIIEIVGDATHVLFEGLDESCWVDPHLIEFIYA